MSGDCAGNPGSFVFPSCGFTQEVENRVCDFCGLFERGLANCGKAQLVCSFYTTQSRRRQSRWQLSSFFSAARVRC